MKNYLIIFLLFISIGSGAQTQALKQLELDIEKLAQLKAMLNNMYSGYNILANGYNNIKDQSLANFNLHKNFLDGLLAISPAVRNDPAIQRILEIQSEIVSEYNNTYKRIRDTKLFNAGELDYFSKAYAQIMNKSSQSLDELQVILTPDKLQMNEAERLSAIERISTEMKNQLAAIRSFTNRANVLVGLRERMKKDNDALRNSYGIQK